MIDPLPISELVPHSGRMVLLDRLVSDDAHSLTADVTIRHDSPFVRDGVVGAWIGIEYMAQAIAAFAGRTAQTEGHPPKIGFLLGARQYNSNVPGFPVGAMLRVTVTRVWQDESGLGSFTATITGDGIKADATLTVFQPADVDQFMAERSG